MTRYFEVGSHYSIFLSLSLCAPRLINIYTVLRVGRGSDGVFPSPPPYSVDNQVIFPFQLVKRAIF